MVFHISVIVGRCTLLSPTFCTSFFLPPLFLLTSCLSTSASLNPDLFVEILNILFTFVFRPEQYLDCGSVLASFMCANCVFSIAFDWMAHTAVSVCVCVGFLFLYFTY